MLYTKPTAKKKRFGPAYDVEFHATSGNRTPPNCLEGNYANHYTNAAVQRKSGCKSVDDCTFKILLSIAVLATFTDLTCVVYTEATPSVTGQST